MRKFLLFIALVLLSVVSMQAKDERYTVFDQSTGTLTYYYDDVREYRSGTKEVYSASATRFEGYNELITRVVIDFTMRNDPSKVFFSLFRGNSAVTLKNVTEIVGLENLNTAGAEDFGCMFYGCSSLTEIDLSSFQTASVSDMRYMFANCSSLTKLDLRGFDISSVSNMYGMFKNCMSLTTILCDDDWSASTTLTTHTDMFDGCMALKGNAGTVYDPNKEDKTYARPDGGAEAPGYFSQMRVYTVYADGVLTYYYDDQMATRSGAKEVYPPANDDFERFVIYHDDITTVVIDTTMKHARLESMKYFFSGGSRYFLTNLTSIVGLENLYTASVTDMKCMFYNCRSLPRLDLRSFNTSNVTDMSLMFKQCYALKEIDVNSFDLTNVENVAMMFDYCEALTTIYCYYDWTQLYSPRWSNSVFRGCEALVGGKGTTYTEDNNGFSYARPDGGEPSPGYFTAGEWQGVESISQEPKAKSQKMIKDGQMLIIKGDKTFNVLGSEIQ